MIGGFGIVFLNSWVWGDANCVCHDDSLGSAWGLGNTERKTTYPDTMVVDTRDGLVENTAGLHEVLAGASFIGSRCESSSMGEMITSHT